MMKKIIAAFSTLLISTPAFSYWASCNTEDGREFSIVVENKVLTVDYKYKHYYKGQTVGGWYKYSNSKYTYLTGPFKGNSFPINVINTRGYTYLGSCQFR